MKAEFVLSIDQGTTGTKVLLVDKNGEIAGHSYKKHKQFYPESGWVEHDPMEIWKAVLECTRLAMDGAGITAEQIISVGLSNQGETVMWWDSISHLPLYPAVVWSCRRSHSIAEKWEKDADWNDHINQKTGLRIDPYFSATKIRWMLDEVPEIQQAVSEGHGKVGTLDSWLIWKMTAGHSHKTDASTAARTLLYNIHTGDYDNEILEYLGFKRDWLPTIMDSIQGKGTNGLGVTSPTEFLGIEAPIHVSLVDQPAALYGHLCVQPGSSKVTYGTGCFAYMNAGLQAPISKHNLLSTVVWSQEGRLTYATDGGVYSAGSSVEWAMNQLELFPEVDTLQQWSLDRLQNTTTLINSTVFYIPALAGIGAPYWDSDARGAFMGMSHNTTKVDLALAILEGIAHRVADVLEAMEQDTGHSIKVLKVDGGLTNNQYLMQFQSDLLGVPVEVPDLEEVTAMGVAYLQGLVNNWWTEEELINKQVVKKRYEPRSSAIERKLARERWKKVLNKVISE